MTKIEYLLICLMEEAAEIQQAAAKALRFGLANHHPDRKATNCMELSREIGDLHAVTEMLNKEHALDTSTMLDAALKKSAKVERFMEVSRDEKILQDGATCPECGKFYPYKALAVDGSGVCVNCTIARIANKRTGGSP